MAEKCSVLAGAAALPLLVFCWVRLWLLPVEGLSGTRKDIVSPALSG